MTSMTVALLQLPSPGPDPSRALREGEQACREAARLGADVALLPEMWSTGYASFAPELATTTGGPIVVAFRTLAAELGMAIVVTYLQAWDGAPRNAATVVDRHGEPILTYAKVHTCDFAREAALTPGDAFPTATLDLPGGDVRIGVMLCYDREFPEAARVLMLGGAEVILTPNACPLDDDRLGQFRARAFENMVGVAMANYAHRHDGGPPDPEHCNGRSAAFSGMVYAPGGTPQDHTLVSAGSEPGIHLATFDLDALRAYRDREQLGAKHRKPRTYARLTMP